MPGAMASKGTPAAFRRPIRVGLVEARMMRAI
jgi:hypothetical protein